MQFMPWTVLFMVPVLLFMEALLLLEGAVCMEAEECCCVRWQERVGVHACQERRRA